MSNTPPAPAAAVTAPASPARRGLCLVLAAASGTGKSSLSRALLEQEEALTLSISATTRAPRPGEEEGVHYFFHTPESFRAMVERGEMLEHAEVHGKFYGTPRAPVEAALAAGRDVLFDIDWQGHRLVRGAMPQDVVSIFLLPPSMAELERRLQVRGQDSAETIARRMAGAREEIAHWQEFDHLVVNQDFAVALGTLRAVLQAARCTPARQPNLRPLIDTLLG